MTDTPTRKPITVAEFIAYLQTQDQEAIVNVLEGKPTYGYEGPTYAFTELNIEEHIDYSDLRGNQFVKPDASYFNQRFLYIGVEA